MHIYAAFVFLQSFNELPLKSYKRPVVHAHILHNIDLNLLLFHRFAAQLSRDKYILNSLFRGT